MTLLFIVLFIVGFSLVAYTLNAWHDSEALKAEGLAFRASRTNDSIEKRVLIKKSLRHNQLWHAIDAFRDGLVIAALVYAFAGFTWWIAILGYVSFAIRWLWFDLNLNWFRGKLPWYTGSVSKTDELTKTVWLQIYIKIFFIAIGVGLIIWNWNVIPL